MLTLSKSLLSVRNLASARRDRVLARFYRIVDRVVATSRAREQKRRWSEHATVAATSQILPEAIVRNLANDASRIRIADHSYIRGELLVFSRSGTIDIGRHCYVGDESRVWSAEQVRIGNRVLISHGVNIHDTNSHPLDAERRHAHFLRIVRPNTGPDFDELCEVRTAPVAIEDDVWIGFQATILKGVTVGRGAIVAACAVVTKDVPQQTIVAGNPAEVIRRL